MGHRGCCPELFPPADWQDTHPGETWLEWHHRTRGMWTGFVSFHGWPMEGMSYGQCICPECQP